MFVWCRRLSHARPCEAPVPPVLTVALEAEVLHQRPCVVVVVVGRRGVQPGLTCVGPPLRRRRLLVCGLGIRLRCASCGICRHARLLRKHAPLQLAPAHGLLLLMQCMLLGVVWEQGSLLVWVGVVLVWVGVVLLGCVLQVP